MMQLESRGLIYDASGQPPESRVNAFTSVRRLKDGTLIAGHQSGPAKHAPTSTVRLHRSSDGGAHWEEIPFRFQTTLDGVPGSLSSGDLVELETGRLLLFGTWFDRSDPERPLFDAETQGVLHSRQVMATSDDRGRTWSPWRIIPTGDLTGCAATGPSLIWSDGAIAHTFESYKEYDDPRPARHGAWLLISRDGGATFPERHLVAQHPAHSIYFWDQRLCTGREPGEYFACFWTHDLEKKTDLTVHLRHGTIGDGNAPIESIRATSMRGQIAAPLLLEDGRLLAFVVDRDRPGTMTLWCSRDEGRTWPDKDKLVVHTHDERAALTQQATDIDFNAYWDDMLKWSFGHPSLVDLHDGRVLCVFYAGAPGCLSIHWARVNVS
jgi:hypothetical protein